MRTGILLVLALLALGSPARATDSERSASRGLVEFESPHPVAQTMDQLAAAAKERGFRVFARIDHAAGAAAVGEELPPTELLIFGNPAGGTPLMQRSATIAIDLPLKALVYQATGGSVRIVFNDPRFLAERHDLDNREAIIERMTGLLTSLATAAAR